MWMYELALQNNGLDTLSPMRSHNHHLGGNPIHCSNYQTFYALFSVIQEKKTLNERRKTHKYIHSNKNKRPFWRGRKGRRVCMFKDLQRNDSDCMLKRDHLEHTTINDWCLFGHLVYMQKARKTEKRRASVIGIITAMGKTYTTNKEGSHTQRLEQWISVHLSTFSPLNLMIVAFVLTKKVQNIVIIFNDTIQQPCNAHECTSMSTNPR